MGDIPLSGSSVAMNKSKWLFLGLVLASGAALAQEKGTPKGNLNPLESNLKIADEPIIFDPSAESLSRSFVKTEDQLKVLVKDANEGDGDSAMNLYLHFSGVENVFMAEYWLLRAALNRNSAAQYNEWVRGSEAVGCDGKGAALAWLEAAAKAGNVSAIRELPKFQDSLKKCGH